MKDRHLDISAKLIEMGRALMKEGVDEKDLSVSQIGTCLIFVGGLMFDEKDIEMFGQLCSMFSAKKILENMEANNDDYLNYLKKKSDSETYEDFIKRINKLRGDNN